MNEKALQKIKILLGIRVLLWIVAILSTIYWIYYSQKLYLDEIYDAYEYSAYLRPVLYKCLIISFVAICVSLVLRFVSDRIKKREHLHG